MRSCRLLPYTVDSGPQNMAGDEVLLESALGGVASLRFYGWDEATLSLGYFQPERARRADPRLESLPFVRRPYGGATLVHHHEVTYAIGVPAAYQGAPIGEKTGSGINDRGSVHGAWLRRMHDIIAAALNELGVTARVHATNSDADARKVLCFQQFTAGDVLVGDSKVVGSAQRRQRGALLQHGAILLFTSPYTPQLPGIRELSGIALTPAEVSAAVQRQFVHQTGWRLITDQLTSSESHRRDELMAAKYSQDTWNCKR